MKSIGSEQFKLGHVEQAAAKYEKALRYLEASFPLPLGFPS